VQASDEARQELYTEVQNIVVDDVPVAWMLELQFPTIYRCDLKNPVSTAIGVNDGMRDAWLDRD
jgi:peptide/nickel transport system substrate-binding protein